ncbi:MAG: hypothetical protein CMJ78_18545 [Planctomycetaceae bacterium]|nr:hypothetical protein [Planctomycetaceae bacterium]
MRASVRDISRTLLLFTFVGLCQSNPANADEAKFVDCSLLVAPGYPSTWPQGFPRFRIIHDRVIGPRSAYNTDILYIDGNTATQMDVPPHSVVRPELKMPKSGKFGHHFTEAIEAWQFGGEACIVDCRDLLNKAPNGVSPLVKIDRLKAWEKKHRPFRFGDVVLVRSDYSDKFYRPLPEGRRFLASPLERKTPAWPDPNPEAMEFLAGVRKVMHVGTDSPTMGPIPDLGEPTHYAALKHGAIFTEAATNLGKLPTTGAFYCLMGPKHKGGPYGEARAFAIVGNVAKFLIDASRNKRAIDLSPTLDIDMPLTWPGKGVDNHRHRYTKADFLYAATLQLYHHTHIMDSHCGTHLVPPSYALPPGKLDVQSYAPEVRGWLEEYERKFGPRGSSTITTADVPLSQTCGWARVIDATSLVGTTNANAWPASPEISVDLIKADEAKNGPLKANQIVIFRTGHIDKHMKAFPEGVELMEDPLNGKSEGWPAVGAAAVTYLAKKGIRCVATDAPTLGGVDDRQALMTYWALGSRNIVGVEFLQNVGKIPDRAYFLFAPVKIQGCHGGPGRAIVLH